MTFISWFLLICDIGLIGFILFHFIGFVFALSALVSGGLSEKTENIISFIIKIFIGIFCIGFGGFLYKLIW
jgi:hypothetical protein